MTISRFDFLRDEGQVDGGRGKQIQIWGEELWLLKCCGHGYLVVTQPFSMVFDCGWLRVYLDWQGFLFWLVHYFELWDGVDAVGHAFVPALDDVFHIFKLCVQALNTPHEFIDRCVLLFHHRGQSFILLLHLTLQNVIVQFFCQVQARLDWDVLLAVVDFCQLGQSHFWWHGVGLVGAFLDQGLLR